jgi:hypothetical protein
VRGAGRPGLPFPQSSLEGDLLSSGTTTTLVLPLHFAGGPRRLPLKLARAVASFGAGGHGDRASRLHNRRAS